jgi:hypothetical protein
MKTLCQQENPRLALDTMDLKKSEAAIDPTNDYVSSEHLSNAFAGPRRNLGSVLYVY